jgi:hypothetical protein
MTEDKYILPEFRGSAEELKRTEEENYAPNPTGNYAESTFSTNPLPGPLPSWP